MTVSLVRHVPYKNENRILNCEEYNVITLTTKYKTMTKNNKTEIDATTENSISQTKPTLKRRKSWALNLLAVLIGFTMICGVLGILDILAQRELRKTGDALPKLFLYRWKKKNAELLSAHDPLTGPTRDLEAVFPNLVDNHLPYIIANYFKIFVRKSCLSNFETHSQMLPRIITPELLSKLERPFIVCLGGSTTEPFLLRYKEDAEGKRIIIANGTWSEELSRMMESKQIRGTVFCGGTGGYTTSNDLLRLLRDVLDIKPDLVISYGGVNDLFTRRDFKMYNYFSYRYYKNNNQQLPKGFIFPNIVRYLSLRESERERIMDLYGGVKSELNEADYMVRNWKIMNEICKLHNIKFYGVFQPCVGSTEKTRNEEKLMSETWLINYLHDDALWRSCFDVLAQNYDLMKPEILKYDFMYDFSDIFDEQDFSIIYPFQFDWCHVSQEGNRIVAENMFKMLFEDKTTTNLAKGKNK
jgi:hypothetical protein